MIDIHCHILPGVDDGVRTMDEALELARMEASGGTRAFIATPHVIDKRDYDRLGELAGRVEELRGALSQAGIPVEIAQGGEIYPTANMVKALDEGLPVTLAGKGRHMLVDLPMGALPHDFDTLLFELQARGVTPILAHPERVAPFLQDPDAFQKYLDRGVSLQVNAGSLAGKYGPRATEVARLILRRHWAQFLASDSHRPGRRPALGSCVSSLVGELDAEYLALLTSESARCVLEGRDHPARPPAAKGEERPKGWLSRLFSRR